MKERTLVVNSMSKSHGMTGWRIGWLTGPQEVIHHLTQLNLVVTYGICDFISRASTVALNEWFGVEEIASTYLNRGKAFLEALGTSNLLKPVNAPGGMYFMFDIREISESGEAFAWSLLNEENIATMPGESFGAAGAGHVRVSLCADEETLAQAAKTIRKFAENFASNKEAH